MLRLKHFGAALAAAPLFWLGWWLVTGTEPDLSWPLRELRRFLLPALFYPVLEELAFRGGVQTLLLRRPWGRRARGGITIANLLTSALFSLLHLYAHSPVWAAAVFIPSLLFGYFRDRSGRLAPSIVLHLWYNAGYFWLFG